MDVLKSVESKEGCRLLLQNGALVGIHIEDFGQVDFYSLDVYEDPPLGYEECFLSYSRYIDKKISIKLPDEWQNEAFIQNCEYYPSNRTEDVKIIILDAEGIDEIKFPIIIHREADWILRYIIPEKFKGRLNKWILLEMEINQQLNDIAQTCTKLGAGVNLTGTVKSEIKLLSIEARPFIPKAMRALFDYPLIYTFTPTLVVGDINLEPPPNYYRILQTEKFKYNIPIASHVQYFDALFNNSFIKLNTEMKSNSIQERKPKTEIESYLLLLKNCLCLEESHMLYDLSQYDLHYIEITKTTGNSGEVLEQFNMFPDMHVFYLTVNGSNENRPKISIGDSIRFRPVEEDLLSFRLTDDFELLGIVQSYSLQTETAVCIIQAPHMELCKKLRYHVRFVFERVGISFMHHSIEQLLRSPELQSRLFPDEATLSKIYRKEIPDYVDMQLNEDLNEKQSQAVRKIVQLSSLNRKLLYPYIIFGPPGTGKTMTVCNAISNLCTIFPSKKILAVCPSDAAADVILTRLARQFGPKIMFRLHWWQRGVASVPIETLRFCHQIDDKFEIPSFEDICEFQIIITTCFCAGSLRHLQSAMNKIHSHEVCLEFDVVIVDEASQASEAETYVPLSLCKQIGLIVLAGDTQQLGPVYRSPAYRDKAISSSLEARLLDTKTYRFLNHLKDVEEDSIDELLLSIHKGDDMAPDSDIVSHRLKNNLGVFLNQNYRSHQVIFEVSSLLFYNSSLEQCGNEEILSLTKWSYLPQTKQFPVLVFGVKGTHKHVIDSPSYYNMDEGNAVVELLTSLLTENIAGERVKQKDIGIIAAFRSQVLLIRTLFRKHKMSNVSVGSVEDFQGQEKKVIIISTVLHSIPPVERGEHIGLFNDHRRFNVSVTRGKALVVVVGHPVALCMDPYFKVYFEYCFKNGAYRGYLSDVATVNTFVSSAKEQASLGEGAAAISHYSDNQEWRVMI